MADKWIQGAVNKEHSGDLREYFGIKEGDTIPQDKLEGLIKRLQGMGNRSAKETHLLRMALMARTLKHF